MFLAGFFNTLSAKNYRLYSPQSTFGFSQEMRFFINFEAKWPKNQYLNKLFYINCQTNNRPIFAAMLWLSTERSNCHFNCASFLLPWVRSLHCPSKDFFPFFYANSLERQHSERAHGKRKIVLFKRQQCLSIDSQSIGDASKQTRAPSNQFFEKL